VSVAPDPATHKLSLNGPWPLCWERKDEPLLEYVAAFEADDVVMATEAHELVTCPACRKEMVDA
jgi:hypothetical protein